MSSVIIQRKKRNKAYGWAKGGFTVVEVLVAIFVIIVGITEIISLLQQTISTTSLSASKLIANYLGQEGIEIVRNIRDNNWLEGRSVAVNWDEGIDPGDYEADYDDQSLSNYTATNLTIDASGFYSYHPGSPTNFKRKITISNKEDFDNPPDGIVDKFSVTVWVSWQYQGKEYSITAQEDLYRWRY